MTIATAEALPDLNPHSGLSQVWTERYTGALMNTFGPPKRVFVRGEGAQLWDADGNRYLDLFAGIAVNALGHAHPLVVQAVTAQLTTLGHVGNFFATAPQIALAERLIGLVGARDARVYFCNSGTEANEAAFKISRLTGRTRIVATEGGFHGRTMGALALTGKSALRAPFEPLPGEVTFVPFGDTAALEAAIDEETAAFIVEPIQGERGVEPAPPGYLTAARRITERHGALLILDEVQTGIARTGTWFRYQAEAREHGGWQPDVISLAKGLGGGLPIGASIALGRAAELFTPGSHGTTFGGNPVACAAGLAVLYGIERDDLLGNVQTIGARLHDGILALDNPALAGVRGAGLLLAVELREAVAPALAEAALNAGFIVNPVTPQAIRLAPPLILTAAQADEFLAVLPRLLDQLTPGSD
ncbi:acetylornithine transaminase [Actinocrinis puniceicyclus]|uniref:Acetylornithine aminotransferase n=1 Tax=Actinocrinis puniceicyclus TaxID=977794 RepID=A0A8J8BDS8_9ACTN|nr:acetylornithine transaminase [Actinocrinis puniceicyclus]MBS2965588.1 acetylornithine transaminase [Actinocrinis puniceicyclus]